MKAIVRRKYGPPDDLKLEEIAKPVPGDNEVLIHVRAASVNPYDWHLIRGVPSPIRLMTGLRRPKEMRTGADASGQVEAVGKNVTGFKPGDEVFGVCAGAFAEYACIPVSAMATKPAASTFEQAASLPIAGLTALQALRDKGKIEAGQKVLINGAAGGVGTFAVQIAKSFGAVVTGVCSTRNVEMVRRIGADEVVDYSREDFTAGSRRFDVLFDLVGNRSTSALLRVLKPRGVFIGCGGGAPDVPASEFLTRAIHQMLLSWFVSQRVVGILAKSRGEDLAILSEMMQSGKITPVIDWCYKLSEVPDAIRYVEEGHAQGKVVISID
jgi:NADPH:quinone reductase-like Zn-dependent oxidoreductase